MVVLVKKPQNYRYYPLLDSYQDAILHRNGLRLKTPAIYNSDRLHERPIPNIYSDDDDDNENHNHVDGANDIPQLEETNEIQNAVVDNDEDIDSNDEDNGREILPLEQVLLVEQEPNEFDNIVKEEFDPITITSVMEIELNRVLGDDSDDSNGLTEDEIQNAAANDGIFDQRENHNEREQSDDGEIVWEKPNDKLPMPMKCTQDVLTKKEDDPVSGSLPYATKVNTYFMMI